MACSHDLPIAQLSQDDSQQCKRAGKDVKSAGKETSGEDVIHQLVKILPAKAAKFTYTARKFNNNIK